MNSTVMVIAFCVFLYGDIFVTSLDTDTEDIGDPDSLSMPLITDKGAPLVAMLDTKSINRKMKIYIQKLMRDSVQNYEKEQTQRMFKTLLEGNSTVEFFRNISLQEITGVLKAKGQDHLINLFRNEGESKQVCGEIVKSNPKAKSGVFLIFPDKKTAVRVYCNMNTVHDGWTIIQRRIDGTVDFQRRLWKDYENGFGNPNGEYWIGNKHIHSLTSSGKYELKIDLTDLSNTKTYAMYATFVVGDAASKYKLIVGNYSGNAGDQMAYHNEMKFSTTDHDYDQYDSNSCVDTFGPWWHKNCCQSALNKELKNKLYWNGNTAKTSVMMIRKL
ncbi:Hypothetical predicted protein [Mytilus galloprovincialis]|uniref:Fibrinogen C-terminal domain-containing protein n=1 Tax=Mytilus galloprovincialis TaxID=29158 RepID=A0A8B6EAJ3_MYTGA|nr:Hypothetical predicted protein [Mytilus galloprovincialis]